MIIAIAAGLCLLVVIVTYLAFGARMAARQKTWLPASTALVVDLPDDARDTGSSATQRAARA